MGRRVDDLIEILEQSLAGKNLGASVKIDLGDDGVVLIKGSVISREDAAAETVLTTSLDVFADALGCYHGKY